MERERDREREREVNKNEESPQHHCFFTVCRKYHTLNFTIMVPYRRKGLQYTSAMETTVQKIERQVLRLSELTGPQDKRIKKRILQSIGKLKRKLEVEGSAESKVEILPEESGGVKRLRVEQDGGLSKKHKKAKLKLLNDEIATLARKKMPAVAQKRISAAIRKGIPADIHTYTNLMNAYVRCDDIDKALQVFHDMKEAGLTPNIVTYTTLAKGLCESHEVKSAADLLYQCPELNARAANTLLRGCLRTGEINVAETILETISKNWGRLRNECSAEYIVALLCQGLRLEDAEQEIERYTSSNEESSDKDIVDSLNCALYVSLSRASLLLGEWKKASQYLKIAGELHAGARTATLRQSMKSHFAKVCRGVCEDVNICNTYIPRRILRADRTLATLAVQTCLCGTATMNWALKWR